LIWFLAVITVFYLGSFGFLLWEFRSTPYENRTTLQTVPLLMGVTSLYLVLLYKVPQFVVFFSAA